MASRNCYRYPIVSKKVRISFHDSPAHVGNLKHAVDFICKVDTPVYAAFSGMVVDIKDDSNIGGKSRSFDSFGNFIEIRHRFGEYSIYEHIKKGSARFKIGDKVDAGQFIARSGKTGWLAHLGPHLHFDVHKYEPRSKTRYKSIKIRWK